MTTIRELQTSLPWTVHYHKDFRASPMSHKDFGHALLHVFKAAGKIAAVVNDAERGGSDFKESDVDRYVADLVVCALRMANTCPGRTIDLEKAVVDRILTKNDVRPSVYHAMTAQPTVTQCCAYVTSLTDTIHLHGCVNKPTVQTVPLEEEQENVCRVCGFTKAKHPAESGHAFDEDLPF